MEAYIMNCKTEKKIWMNMPLWFIKKDVNQEGKIEDEKSEGNKKDPNTFIFYDRAERFVYVQEKRHVE